MGYVYGGMFPVRSDNLLSFPSYFVSSFCLCLRLEFLNPLLRTREDGFLVPDVGHAFMLDDFGRPLREVGEGIEARHDGFGEQPVVGE